MKEQVKRANELFSKGCNCAQASFAALSEEAGLSEKDCMLIASAFGGGIAKSGGLCGGLTGALMAAGAIKGYTCEATTDSNSEKAAQVKAAFGDDMEKIRLAFEKEFSTSICKELCEKNEQDVAAGLIPEDEKPCARYVRYSVELVLDYIK